MNNGNNSTDISSGSSSSRGNGANNKKNIIKKQLLPKEPKRGMGIAKLEKIRLSAALNKSPYSQEFDMIGQAASYHSAYSLCQAPAPPSLSTFGNHQQPNADSTMFGGLVEVNMTTAHDVNPQPSSCDRSYAFDSNNAWAVRHQHQPHFGQPGVASSRPTSLLIPSRARDATGNIEMDLLGKRRRREEGVPNRDEEIDLELRL